MSKRCDNFEILQELVNNNQKARESCVDSDFMLYHEKCGDCVRKLMKGNCGVVTNTFRYLEELGQGRPGDSTCLITFEYANRLILEEKNRSILTMLFAEKMERKIKNLLDEKRYEEKGAMTPLL